MAKSRRLTAKPGFKLLIAQVLTCAVREEVTN